jgi:hypothetical protein
LPVPGIEPRMPTTSELLAVLQTSTVAHSQREFSRLVVDGCGLAPAASGATKRPSTQAAAEIHLRTLSP